MRRAAGTETERALAVDVTFTRRETCSCHRRAVYGGTSTALGLGQSLSGCSTVVSASTAVGLAETAAEVADSPYLPR
jgi:hypothetical protein